MTDIKTMRQRWADQVRDEAAGILSKCNGPMSNIALAKALRIKPRAMAALLRHDGRFLSEIRMGKVGDIRRAETWHRFKANRSKKEALEDRVSALEHELVALRQQVERLGSLGDAVPGDNITIGGEDFLIRRVEYPHRSPLPR